MNEKINVLGVNIDSFTAKEAMKETIAFLESEPVSVIDVDERSPGTERKDE